MNEYVLQCRGLCKRYQAIRPVLDRLDFDVPAGKIMGLLGPNGCGKSTFLKLVSGLLTPDSGEILICGEKRSQKSNAEISLLPERPSFEPRLKVDGLVEFYKDFYPDFDEKAARKMFADLAIDPKAPMKTLSKGTKEKVQLILTMSRRAKLYLLDEPIGGVDPAARDYILRTIIAGRNPEAAVIITTHLIADVEPALDEFAFMGFGGKIMMQGSVEQTRQAQGKTLDELFREVFRCSGNV